MKTFKRGLVAAGLVVGVLAGSAPAHAEVDLQSLLREGLLGAGVGALSAGVGKGNAGTGALVGAGTQIIGGSLLSFLTEPSTGGYGRSGHVSQRQVYAAEPVYYAQSQPTYVYNQPTYGRASQDESVKKAIKQGLLGAGVGALSAGVGKGNAGTGALVGAGTTVIGGALLDFLIDPAPAASGPQSVYYSAPPTSSRSLRQSRKTPHAVMPAAPPLEKRIVRTYDSDGNLLGEEEFWQ